MTIRQLRNYIDGRFEDGASTFDKHSPVDHALIAQAPNIQGRRPTARQVPPAQQGRQANKPIYLFKEYPMYAVVKTGGKQYRVAIGEKLKVEQIPADIGQEITLDQVLSVGEGDQLKVGTPLVAGAVIKATVLAQGRHDKVKIFKMRRRKHYQKRQGHRQNYTEIRIEAITA